MKDFAFPQSESAGSVSVTQGGMTMRDAFAIAAMSHAWDINRKYVSISGDFTCEAVARDAYEMADAFLAERER